MLSYSVRFSRRAVTRPGSGGRAASCRANAVSIQRVTSSSSRVRRAAGRARPASGACASSRPPSPTSSGRPAPWPRSRSASGPGRRCAAPGCGTRSRSARGRGFTSRSKSAAPPAAGPATRAIEDGEQGASRPLQETTCAQYTTPAPRGDARSQPRRIRLHRSLEGRDAAGPRLALEQPAAHGHEELVPLAARRRRARLGTAGGRAAR